MRLQDSTDLRRPASADPQRPAALRVASVPSTHVYIRHLGPADGPAPFEFLPDPDPDDPTQVAQGRWWPPAMLDPQWVRAADFDVFHVQFGFDARSPEDLAALVAALKERGTPFVQTVHDLRNPHHPDRTLHDAQLDVLVPAADALVTLTDGAADEIRRRWGREAHVVPHPHVIDFATMERLLRQRDERRSGEFRVGVHIKSLRQSMDPLPVIKVLADVLAGIPGGVLQVNGHHDVLDPDGARRDDEVATWLTEAAAAGRIDLRVHDFMPDEDLWDYLGSLDVTVLPYRFGTHSGWLEACRDAGTMVVAPTCGYYADQAPVLTFGFDEEHFDEQSLRDAIVRAHDERPDHRATVEERRAQRDHVARLHERLYRSLT